MNYIIFGTEIVQKILKGKSFQAKTSGPNLPLTRFE